MKYTIEHIIKGEDELILKYKDLTKEVEKVVNFMNSLERKIVGTIGEKTVIIDPSMILYVESVDRKTFVYTSADVYRIDLTLIQFEGLMNTVDFFRCSKSMVININKIVELKSLASNRIDAKLCNGEHIIISRTYASEFRRVLKGEQ